MKITTPHKKVRSLEFSGSAHVKPVKAKQWQYVGKRGKKAPPVSIAIITPQPGKGFLFQGVLRSFAETMEAVKAAGFNTYRQGGMLTKSGEVNRLLRVA